MTSNPLSSSCSYNLTGRKYSSYNPLPFPTPSKPQNKIRNKKAKVGELQNEALRQVPLSPSEVVCAHPPETHSMPCMWAITQPLPVETEGLHLLGCQSSISSKPEKAWKGQGLSILLFTGQKNTRSPVNCNNSELLLFHSSSHPTGSEFPI